MFQPNKCLNFSQCQEKRYTKFNLKTICFYSDTRADKDEETSDTRADQDEEPSEEISRVCFDTH